MSKKTVKNNISYDIEDISRRRILKSTMALSVLGLGSGALSGCNDSDSNSNTEDNTDSNNQNISSFSLVALPDTQFYSRYAANSGSAQFYKNFGSEPFSAQTKWIANNARDFNIAFVTHLGDIVDQSWVDDSWDIANKAMGILEAFSIPYSILAGNHDVNDESADRDPANEPYLNYFNGNRASKIKTFKGRDETDFHEYHIFDAEGHQFLVLALSWNISQEGIAWANKVLADNPTLPAILTSHDMLGIATDGVTAVEGGYGKKIWDEIINKNDQIFMTLNGHNHGSAYMVKTNASGNSVIEMVVDYQMYYQGGNGLMRLYEFDLTNNKIHAISFSPWVLEKPENTLTEYDLAVLDSDNEDYTINFDFAKRFAGFNPDFAANNITQNTSAIASAVRTSLLDNYTQPEPIIMTPPKDENDYPVVDGTVAHWRFFGGDDGVAIPEDYEIQDISAIGGSPVKRAKLNSERGVENAELTDLVWSKDRHYLSACPGSARFLNSKNGNAGVGSRMSYFMTDTNAPINGITFLDGYTIEAFIKIDEDWTVSDNQWMNIMTRDGRGDYLPNWVGGWPPTPIQFAFSNLREIQWEIAIATPEDDGTLHSASNWSGEIIAGTWIHIAIVNTVVSDSEVSTIMYVEGSPILRNSYNTRGINTLGNDIPLVIGGGGGGNYPQFPDLSRSNGYFGNIGEIRIVDRPLTRDQWLTARRK